MKAFVDGEQQVGLVINFICLCVWCDSVKSLRRLKKVSQPLLSSPTGTNILLMLPLLSSLAISAMVPFLLDDFSIHKVWSSILVSLKNRWLIGADNKEEKQEANHETEDQ